MGERAGRLRTGARSAGRGAGIASQRAGAALVEAVGKLGHQGFEACAAQYVPQFALIGLGLGALVRHAAAAVSLVFAILFVLPLLAFTLQHHGAIIHYTPFLIAQDSMVTVKPVGGAIAPWPGLLVMCLYAAAALTAGCWALTRRDA